MKSALTYLGIFLVFSFLPAAPRATESIAISAVSGAASNVQPQGRFELFVANPGSSGGIFHVWQLLNQAGWNQQWQTYLPVPDNNPHGLVSGRDGKGRIAVAWISKGSIYFEEALAADASLSQPGSPLGPIVDPFDHKAHKFVYLTMASNPDGNLELLALTDRGRVYSVKETSTSLSSFWLGSTVPTLIGGGNLKSISVTNLGPGLAVVGLGDDGKVYAKNQKVAGTWDPDPWQNLDGNKIQEIHAKESSQHQLEILALGADGNLYLQFQNVNSNTFSGWSIVATRPTGPAPGFGSTILFDRAKDGTLFLVTHWNVAGDSQWFGSFFKSFQTPNNGGWPDKTFGYFTVLVTQAGTDSNADLGWLSRTAFSMAIDAKGAAHYFATRHSDNNNVVEEYVDNTISSSAYLGIQPPSGMQSIPPLPYKP